jgi:hypothetical protein
MSEPSAPAFWFGFEVSRAKLVAVRTLVFGLLAIDALLQIRHAPRYGAGGFNVAHVWILDDAAPSRVVMGLAELALAYAFVLVACGVAVRVVLPCAAAVYAWIYFSSQLDSFQHHYLVAIVLALACFVPWSSRDDRVASWALRLILVELGIVYLWAAVSKLDAAWLDGSTLRDQLRGSMATIIDRTIGFASASGTVVAIELVLAATVWRPRAWKIALPLGLALHLAIALSGLEIGVFAWLMIALYAFVVPDAAWAWLARRIPSRDRVLAAIGRHARLASAIAIVAGIVLARACRFEGAMWLAIGASVVPVVASFARSPALVVAHVLAIACWFAVDRASTVTYDYYRFWGGGARQLGDRVEAREAYEAFVDAFPDAAYAHLQLGRVLIASDRPADGVRELHAAQELAPHDARAFVEEARYFARIGRRREALERADAATFADPFDRDARRLYDLLRTGRVPRALDDEREQP